MKKVIQIILASLIGIVSTTFAQVVISEVDPAAGHIELHNSGDEAIDVSGMFFCNRPAYTPVSALDVISGEITIPAGGYLVVSWSSVAAEDAELGLYSSPNYSSSEAIMSYVAWGSAGHGREGVAVEAGLWEAGSFLELPEEGQTLSHTSMESMMADGWAATESSLGEANTMQ